MRFSSQINDLISLRDMEVLLKCVFRLTGSSRSKYTQFLNNPSMV